MISPLSRQPQHAANIAVRSGTALKWANYVKGWQKRYFVLDSHGVLSYYKTKGEMSGGCRGAVHIKDAVFDRVAGAMELIVSNIDQSMTFHLRFKTEVEMMQWIVSLETAQQQQREAEEMEQMLHEETIEEEEDEMDDDRYSEGSSYEVVHRNTDEQHQHGLQHRNVAGNDNGGDDGGGSSEGDAETMMTSRIEPPETPAWSEPGVHGFQAAGTPPPYRRRNNLLAARGEIDGGSGSSTVVIGSGGGSSVASMDSTTPAVYQITKEKLQMSGENNDGFRRTEEYLQSINPVQQQYPGGGVHNVQSQHSRGGSSAQSEASHGSAQSAPLSEISEWGDALDESDSVSDDDDADGAGSGRRGWMKGLPQAREMETLEKMLMRVQEMRRHFFKETESFRKLANARAAVETGEAATDAAEEEARAAVHCRAADVVSSADELLLRASDHFRELGTAFSKSEQNVEMLREQVSVLHSDYAGLRQQSGDILPNMPPLASMALSASLSANTPILTTPNTSPVKSISNGNGKGNNSSASFREDSSIYTSPQSRSNASFDDSGGGIGAMTIATSSPVAAPSGDGGVHGVVGDGVMFQSPMRQGGGRRPGSPNASFSNLPAAFCTPPHPTQYDGSGSSSVSRERTSSSGSRSTGKRRSSQGGRRSNALSDRNSSCGGSGANGGGGGGGGDGGNGSGGSVKRLPCGSVASAAVDLLLGLRPESLPQRAGARDPGAAAVSSVPVTTSTSFWGGGSSVDTVDAKLADAEKSNLSHSEEVVGAQALRVLSVRHKESLEVRDLMQVVRGYENAKARSAETSAAARKIALWREEIGFSRILQTPLAQRDDFHKGWTETIYGEDRYGHPLIGLTVRNVDAEKLKEYPQDVLEKLVAQKLAGYRAYMEYLSCHNGEQRYKVSYLIDLEDAGMSAFMGETKNTMQKIFGIGGNYFPESVWKIYCYNTPIAVRMGWSVIKAMIHPNTQAKVKILGSASAAIKLLKADGFLPSALPEKLQGSNKGLPCIDLLDMLAKATPKATFGRRAAGSPRDKGGAHPRPGRHSPLPK